MKQMIVLLCGVLFFNGISAHSIYLVRHAEKQTGNNPSLTKQGKERAKHLAHLLQHVDLAYVYSTQYFRTEETAAPTAEAKGLTIMSYDPSDVVMFANQLAALDGDALVVGHSNTTPQLAALLSGQEVAQLTEKDYGDVYLVVIDGEHKSLQHLQIAPFVEKTPSSKTTIEEVLNFVRFSDRLHTAGQPPESVLQSLAEQQYDVVINLAPAQSQGSIEHEGGLVSAAGASYLNIPVNWKRPTEQDFVLFSQVLNSAHVDKALVHCQMNMRASAFTFLYQVIHEKVEPAKAFEHMKKVWVPNDQWRQFVQQILDKNGIDFVIK